jgi:hypothetical protein
MQQHTRRLSQLKLMHNATTAVKRYLSIQIGCQAAEDIQGRVGRRCSRAANSVASLDGLCSSKINLVLTHNGNHRCS